MEKDQKAIERIKMASEMSLHHYGKPLVCTYSGGKDSDVMLELFKRSGIPFEVYNSHTTADAPQTVYHNREVFRELELQGIKCTIDYHVNPDGSRTTMWNLIPQKLMPPTRLMRYCCSELKETGCANRMIATGVRWDESTNRKSRESFEVLSKNKKNQVKVSDEKMLLSDCDETRKLFERCQMKAKTVVNPIIDWNTSDIWDFINSEKIITNCMYEQMGYERVGCIACPMAKKKKRREEFADFPQYKQIYIHAFDRMIEERKKRGKTVDWACGEEVFLWWMEDDNIPGQMSIEDFPGFMPDELN